MTRLPDLFPALLVASARALPLFAALAAPISAQMFEVYPSRPDVSWTTSTRLGLGLDAGEILMHIPASHFRSVGNIGNGTCDCRLAYRFEVRFWDEDRATAESFTPVIRGWTGTEPGVLLNPLTAASLTPVGVGPGEVSQTIYFLFPQLSVTIPCEAGFCIGVKVGAATSTDGLSVLAAEYRPGGAAVPATGDYPRALTPSYAWSQITSFSWVHHPDASGLALAFAVDTRTPILNLGNRAPSIPSVSYGVGGMFPDNASAARYDGLDLRIQDWSRPFGLAMVFMDIAPVGGTPFGTVLGCFNTLPNIVFMAPLNASGELRMPLLPQGPATNADLDGDVWIQAMTIDSSFTSFHFSNAQKVVFD